MQLPIFIAGLFVSIVFSVVIGMLAGFETVQLILFVIAVTVALQLAFVLIVAVMAASRKRKLREAEDAASAPTGSVPQETDV